MKKNDFWFISLLAWFLIAVSSKWNFWACLMVILHGLVVLWDVAARAGKLLKKGVEPHG